MQTIEQQRQMFVEKRDVNNTHGIPNPKNVDWDKQLEETILLNHDAARSDGWEDSTLEVLEKYVPFKVEDYEMVDAVKDVLKMESWKDLSAFVSDDMCLDFFNLALNYCLDEGQSHKEDKGFIDGSGIGYATAYTDRLKVTLEQTFDVKWTYKIRRPVVYAYDKHKLDLTTIANHHAPNHPSYITGHGCKFLTANETLADVFNLDKKCRRTQLIAGCIASCGRSGSLIHYPFENCMAGRLTTLPEFKDYGKEILQGQ